MAAIPIQSADGGMMKRQMKMIIVALESAWTRRTTMNDMEQLLLIVLTALACPLVLPALLDEKENDND